MRTNKTGNRMSFLEILIAFFIPFKPLIDKTKSSREMQIALIIASVVIYTVPIIFYIATKNIVLALIPWLIIVWVIKQINDSTEKRSSDT